MFMYASVYVCVCMYVSGGEVVGRYVCMYVCVASVSIDVYVCVCVEVWGG